MGDVPHLGQQRPHLPPQALLLSGRRAGLFTYIYTKGGKGLSVDVCLT